MSIYLDVAATANRSSADDIVINTMVEAMREYWQNPSSLYAVNVKEEINRCRVNIAKFIGAKSDEIYFTSGASESNNWAIQGWVKYQIPPFINVVTTPIEHKSISKTVNSMEPKCFVRYCKVDEFGLVNYQSLESLLKDWHHNSVLVSVGFANSEIGTMQDIKKISDLVHKYNGVLHVDATQVLPYISIDVEELGIDLMSTSGHKVSPVLKGIGFLYKRNSVDINPLIYGAQENQMRGGTENTFGIIGLSKAIDHCDTSEDRLRNLCSKRDYFIGCLEYKFGCKLNGHPTERLPNNINVTFPQNITGESLLYMLDMSNIQIGIGSACNSHSIEPSYVLKAIGLNDEQAMKTIRITLSNDITYEQIDCVIDEIDKAIKLIEI